MSVFASLIAHGSVAFTNLADDGRRIDAVFAVIIGQRRFHRLFCEHRAVDLGGGKPIERLDNRLVRKLERVLDGGAFDHVGRHGACGDRCAAAERF